MASGNFRSTSRYNTETRLQTTIVEIYNPRLLAPPPSPTGLAWTVHWKIEKNREGESVSYDCPWGWTSWYSIFSVPSHRNENWMYHNPLDFIFLFFPLSLLSIFPFLSANRTVMARKCTFAQSFPVKTPTVRAFSNENAEIGELKVRYYRLTWPYLNYWSTSGSNI